MSKYRPLAEWLVQNADTQVTLSLDQVEHVLGFPLPDSARKYQPFWASNVIGPELARVGWLARARLAAGEVQFARRSATPSAAPRTAPSTVQPVPTDRADLVLVGCVKTKLAGRHPAQALYISPLFLGRRAHAEACGVPWYVLSAKYGLLAPDQEVDSYDLALVDLAPAERRAWSERVLQALDQQYGSVAGQTVEIRPGTEYRESGLESGLRQRGARVSVPLRGVEIGQQLAWYAGRPPAPSAARAASATASPTPPAPPAKMSGIARCITEEFYGGQLDLLLRAGAPRPGWDAMPECVAVAQIKQQGASPAWVRIFLTLVAAMDRARDADRLWASAARLFEHERWVFQPSAVAQRSFSELRDSLARYGVSQRHGPDTIGWRRILEALGDQRSPVAVRRAIREGTGDAQELLRAVSLAAPSGNPWFPFLRGPKISVMWVRMLADPGEAAISNLAVLPVAVDVQVRKLTEYLGVTDTGDRPLEEVRTIIQTAWQGLASESAGPPALAGTGAALDPALWFYAKWGCTFCERFGDRTPIGSACSSCRFPDTRARDVSMVTRPGPSPDAPPARVLPPPSDSSADEGYSLSGRGRPLQQRVPGVRPLEPDF